MQIKMLSHTVVSGKSVKPNTVIQVSEIDGKMLIGMKKAEAFTPPKPKAKTRSRKHDV